MMGCGLKKVGNLLAELDSRKGIGLITRIRQGLGRPDKIYVRKCTQQDMYKRNIQTRQNDISGNAKMTGTDMSEMPGNDTEDNKTEIIKKLYEGNATGKIPDKHFERLLADYDREQTALETEIEDLQEQIDSFNEDNTKADKFIAVVRRYTDFTELTTPMLNEFIEKVVVHEATGGRTDRKQKIDVYFNFVGQVELPPDRA